MPVGLLKKYTHTVLTFNVSFVPCNARQGDSVYGVLWSRFNFALLSHPFLSAGVAGGSEGELK